SSGILRPEAGSRSGPAGSTSVGARTRASVVLCQVVVVVRLSNRCDAARPPLGHGFSGPVTLRTLDTSHTPETGGRGRNAEVPRGQGAVRTGAAAGHKTADRNGADRAR